MLRGGILRDGAFFAIARIKSSSGAFDVKNAPSQIKNDLSPF